MLSATRHAASCTEARARRAYRTVGSISGLPSSRPVTGRLPLVPTLRSHTSDLDQLTVEAFGGVSMSVARLSEILSAAVFTESRAR